MPRSASTRRIAPVPRRRPRSRDRRGLPPHPRDRRAARPGRDRVRLRRARRARLGEGAAPRVAGHARARHRGAADPPGPRAHRLLRLDRNRLLAPATSAACSSPATWGSRRTTKASPRVRRRGRSRAPKPAGAARPTGSSLGRLAARATSRARRIRTSRTTTATAAQDKAELTATRPRLDHAARRRDSRAESRHGKVPLQAVVDAALEFIERSTARTSQLDHRAAAALVDYVEGAARARSVLVLAAEALRFIRERVQSLQVAPERPRPGHLYVCRLRSRPATAGRPHLFVVGLEEGRVFPTASEDPVLLDAERAGISPALRLSDRQDRRSRLCRAVAPGTGATCRERPAPRIADLRASPSATPAATRASSARPTPRG